MMFPITEAMEIDRALKMKGYDRGLGVFDKYYSKFSEEELSAIEEITIQGGTSINFLYYLPNLKCLTIQSHDYNRVIGGEYQGNKLFNQIPDFSVISTLKRLEYLHIENDICIEELDVRGLEYLKTVYLINNPKLKSILGMDEQHKLEDVIMYGNNITNFPNIHSYLHNTLDARNNILDVSIFFTFIKSIEDAKNLNDMDLNGLIRLKFAEKNGLVNFTTLSVGQITNLYIKFKRLFEQKGLVNDYDENKIAYVFKYVVDYIRFARDELAEREKLYTEIIYTYNEIPEFYKKNMGALHNSYNTYHFRRGNCEGIVNLMRFMLSILQIETENVHCHDNRYRGALTSNHALLRAKSDGRWLYYDATYDRRNLGKFFGKTFNEISEYVDLSVFENQISEGDNYGVGQYVGAPIAK